ncbi:MAG TPA: phage portal protein [Alphaproteobacteria bacterium]|nr:phage portal protein [Alphaproteobacteria bacterium]
MGLKTFLTGMMRAPAAIKTSVAGPMIAWSSVGQPKWTPRRYHNLAEEGFRKNVIAYRCVMMIATSAASVPWLLYDDQGDELDQHPLLQLLNHPNPLQDGVSFLENIYAHLEIAGNAYIEAVRPADHRAPVELYVLRPDRMKVVPGPTGLPQGYQYTVNGQVTSWSADPVTGASNILHLKRFHPLDDWYGMPPMEAAAVSIDQHNAAGSWNQALLNQGARPSGALVFAPKDGPSTLSDDQVQRLREELGQLYQGDRNAGRPLILEGGLDWREMSLSPKDMDWLSGRNAAARDIALAFGVPAQMVGVPDAQTYSNMEQARLGFYEETILPLVTRVIAGVDHWLTPMFDDHLELDFDPDGISALAPRRDMQWSKIQNANFLTVNEKREAVGYGAIFGGDRIKGRRMPRTTRKDDELGDDGGDDDGWGNGGNDLGDEGDISLSDSPLDPLGDDLGGAIGSPLDTWGNPDTLNDHFERHGDDFDADTHEDYTRQANEFYQRIEDDGIPAVQGNNGRIRAYEPETNTFGVYNPDGTTATFYKPPEGLDYFQDQIDEDLANGGRMINPLPEDISGDDAGGGGGGGGLDILHPLVPGRNPWEEPNE